MGKKLLILHIIFFLLLAAGLANGQQGNTDDLQPSPDISGEVLRLVLIPEKNVFEQRRRYKYISDYLSKKLDMPVLVEVMGNYGDICDAFLEGRADAGFFGSFSYVLTRSKAGIQPLVRPLWLNEKSTYRGYIITRKDSGIKAVEDMQNKSLILVDKVTTAGYLFPMYFFMYSGIGNPDDYFSKIIFAGAHDAASWAVYTGEAEIGGVKNNIFNALAEENPDFREQMRILFESPEVPSNNLAVSSSLNPAIKIRIRNVLLNLHESEEGQQVLRKFGAIRFVETTDEDYRVLYTMVNALNINLQEYPYK